MYRTYENIEVSRKILLDQTVEKSPDKGVWYIDYIF